MIYNNFNKKEDDLDMKINFDINDFIETFKNSCHKMQMKTFNKGEVITSYIQKRNQFCILITGNADLVRYDYNGDRTIVEHFSKNDIFGEVFYKYDEIHTKCRNNCKFHQRLSEFLPELILSKVTNLNMRVELLTKRSTRDKLIGYFSSLSTRNYSKSFTLPFSLTDLADYLSVDRSAMMRELKLLKEDGFIEKNGNRITLLYK